MQLRDKKTLVLIPGVGCNQDVWCAQIDGLSDVVDVVVPDISAYSNIVEMAATVLAQAKGEFYLVGFSLGSWVALHIATSAPERVIKLALIAAPEYSLIRRDLLAAGKKQIEQLGFEKYINKVYSQYVSSSNYGDIELKNKMLNMMRAVGKDAVIRGIDALLHYNKPFRYAKLKDRESLIIDGEDDQRIPSESNSQLAKKIPGAKVIILSQAGHFVSMEQPEKLTHILREWIGV